MTQLPLNLSELRRQYGATALELSQMHACPFEQARIWLAQAVSTEQNDPTAMVLSTVDEHSRPDARVLLLKDIKQEGFVFYTHYQSAKGLQLTSNAYAAMTFYWPTLARQLRLRGKVERASKATSDAYFSSRPYLSQLSACASMQSQVIPDRALLEAKINALMQSTPEGAVSRPSEWGGYILYPDTFEFWQGRDNRLHDRAAYHLQNKTWNLSRLAP